MNNEFLIILGSYSAIFILTLAFFNFLTAGLLFKFIGAKASRGKKILIIIHTVTNSYFKLGKIDEGFLRFKDENKKGRTFPVNKEDVYRLMTVNTIEVDDINSNIINKFGSPHNNRYDAVKTDEFLERAITRPNMGGLSKELIIMIVVLILLIGIAILIFQRTEEIIKVIPQMGVI